jgi:hypothetical protein
MHYLRQLSQVTNVIPLLCQADLLSQEEVQASKEQIRSQLLEANIRPFSFDSAASLDQSVTGLGGPYPYAISSAIGSDHDTMDASLLMSPDYVQPLIPTELSKLVDQVFNENGASWLRHSAANKYIQWKKAENPSKEMALYHPLGPVSSYAVSQVLTPPTGATSSFALARITDHTQREERLAQIRLASWAADLQRSLANEQARFEQLARNQRAVWLTERLNECVQEGTLVPASQGDRRRRRKVDSGRGFSSKTMVHQDPLGLLEVAANLRRKGLVALELLGSLSVVGGLVLWASRHHWHSQYDWVISEWERFWYGSRA